MRCILLAGIAACQFAAAPAAAADLVLDRPIVSQRTGTFTGVRLRTQLGGGQRQGELRAGLVVGPILRTDHDDRARSHRIGDGIELGLSSDRPLALSIAGRPLTGAHARRLAGPRAGVSTLAWVAIGTGVVLVVGTLLFADAMNDASE